MIESIEPSRLDQKWVEWRSARGGGLIFRAELPSAARTKAPHNPSHAGQWQDTIRVLAERLRGGKTLDDTQLDALARAYQAVNRSMDAGRALTDKLVLPDARPQNPQGPNRGGGFF